MHLSWDFITHLQIDSSTLQLGLFTVHHASRLRTEVSAVWGQAAEGSTSCAAEAEHQHQAGHTERRMLQEAPPAYPKS